MKNQSGNVLVFILIAIGLIGLLTVTLTRSSNTTNDSGDYERNEITASEILRYAKTIENAVQSLLARGCSENELSFWHDSDSNGTEDASDDYFNPNSPTDHSCHVFEPEGAGITYVDPKENWLDTPTPWAFVSHLQVEGVGTNATELRLSLNFLKESLCLSVNNSLGVTNPSDAPPFDGNTVSASIFFAGVYGSPVADNIGDDGGHNLAEKTTFCREGNTSGIYQFNHVLHAR